jgi:tripartite-type tricarboxylate transporter receptor subunit TctC
MPEVRSRAEQAGFEITPSTPQALRDRIQSDVALYGPLVADGRIARL